MPSSTTQTTTQERVIEVKPSQRIPDVVTQKVNEIMQKMIATTNELALEVATIECNQSNTCPICLKARELVKLIKELYNMLKQIAPS